MGIARTFQNIRLFRNLTVLDNVLIGLNNEMKYSAASAILRLPEYWKRERIAKERTLELLSIFNMENVADHLAGSLPYGAQRRLEIVRALATNPCLLLLDGRRHEPLRDQRAHGEHRQDPRHLRHRHHAHRA